MYTYIYLLHIWDKVPLPEGFNIFLTADLFDNSVTLWPWSDQCG